MPEFKVELLEEESPIFAQCGIDEPLKELHHCKKSDRLIALTESGKLFLLKIALDENKKVQVKVLGNKILVHILNSKIEHGVVYA